MWLSVADSRRTCKWPPPLVCPRPSVGERVVEVEGGACGHYFRIQWPSGYKDTRIRKFVAWKGKSSGPIRHSQQQRPKRQMVQAEPCF